MDKIRVFVADADPFVRWGMASVIEQQYSDDMELVGDADEGLDGVLGSHPDVVLMGCRPTEVAVLDTIRQMTSALPEVSVLVFTDCDRVDFFSQAFAAGARGFIHKRAEVDDLITTIYTVVKDRQHSQRNGPALLCGFQSIRLDCGQYYFGYEKLSAREKEVLPLLAEGRRNLDVATELGLSPLTIQTHRRRIMKKLDIHESIGLTKYALQTGLITTHSLNYRA